MNTPLRKAVLKAVLLGFTVFLSACGFLTSDEERLDRAVAEVREGQYRAAMIDLKNILRNDGSNAQARYLLATVTLGLGDIPSAEKEVRLAGELGADTVAVTQLLLNILLAKGDYETVLLTVVAQESVLPQEVRWRASGAAHLGLRDHTSASALFEQWQHNDGDALAPVVGLANALVMQQKYLAAEELLHGFSGITGDETDYWRSLGEVKYRLGKYEESKAAYDKAIAHFKSQTDIFKYIEILAGLIEVELSQPDIEGAKLNLNSLTAVAPGHPATLFLSARIARLTDDDALAARHLQTLLNVMPDHVPAQLALAGTQLSLGNIGQAEALLNRAIATEPGNISARALLARVQLRRLDPGSAVEILSPLLETNTADPRLYNVLAQASIQKGEMASAVELLRTASDFAPDDIESRMNLAAGYLLVDKPEQTLNLLHGIADGSGRNFRREELKMMALVAMNKAAEADDVANELVRGFGSNELAVIAAANHFIRTDELVAAGRLLRNFAERDPDVPQVLSQLGIVEMRAGKLQQAAAHFTETLELQQDNLDGLLGLARIAELEGNFERQKQLLTNAVSFHHQAVLPRALLIERLLNDGLALEAEELADEIVRLGWGREEVGELIATVFLQVGRYDDAMVQVRAIQRTGELSAGAKLSIARAQLALGKPSLARATLHDILDDSPEWVPAITTLALIEIGQARDAEANNLISAYRRAEPESAGSFLLEGELYFQRGEYERSANALHEAADRGAGRTAILRQFQARKLAGLEAPESVLTAWLQVNPDDELSRKFLAQHYQSDGRLDDAVSEYLRVLDSEPDDYAVMNNLAWHYQKIGDVDSAISFAERAYALAPKSGPIVDTLGWIYYEAGQFDKSSRILSDASRLSPDNGEIQYHYAVVLSKLGRKQEARRVLDASAAAQLRYPSKSLAEELMREL